MRECARFAHLAPNRNILSGKHRRVRGRLVAISLHLHATCVRRRGEKILSDMLLFFFFWCQTGALARLSLVRKRIKNKKCWVP